MKTASNQASPSRRRPRVTDSGCSDDASANAGSISRFSRLQPNAARRGLWHVALFQKPLDRAHEGLARRAMGVPELAFCLLAAPVFVAGI